ncbi:MULTISPECIES: 6-phosphogluconolactonase [Prochlorococcus]|uniref:6-phosphogluconolactonase n=1 Tax=Prochlorococcus TaxID=1218 RepID=UPI0005339ECF|nr:MULTISPECIES: 6-phosphogluconolactonase [Prochlorococcus]KGG12355.1 6-phosphogluconolactonase [Prochlorococcus sp. MIT 0601]
MSTYTIQSFPDKNSLAIKTSEIIKHHILLNLEQHARCRIALSGGSTPSASYSLLGKENLAWNKVDVFLGDERWVDYDHPLSNALMIKNTLLSSPPGSEANFYPIPTTQLESPKASASAFEMLLKSFIDKGTPLFDLVLLGLGEDGHTASLFPGTHSLHVLDSLATTSSGNNQDRVTLTSTAINLSRKVIFLVSGSSKKLALKRLVDPYEEYTRTPAKLISTSAEILILADSAATAHI